MSVSTQLVPHHCNLAQGQPLLCLVPSRLPGSILIMYHVANENVLE